MPQWSGGTDGVIAAEGDPDLSPKDTPYWPAMSGPVPPSWLIPLGPREGRAENFIRFGRTHADKSVANKKNNFIRLGRENPRQNNFIRLGRGGQDDAFFGTGWKWATDGVGSLRETPSDYGTTTV